jgi:hypothetical protein
MVDALLSASVVDSLPAPPAAATDCETFRVTAPATGEWEGREDQIAVLTAGSWQFVGPQEGMSIFDRQAATLVHYSSGWESAVEPSAPTSGTSVDAEARQMLSDLVEALRVTGIFARPA